MLKYLNTSQRKVVNKYDGGNILLYGPMGMGQPEIAEYLADKISCEVVDLVGAEAMDVYEELNYKDDAVYISLGYISGFDYYLEFEKPSEATVRMIMRENNICGEREFRLLSRCESISQIHREIRRRCHNVH